MEYTKNYKLPQWAETDRILMEDFNQAMADIDAGLDAVKSEAATERAAMNQTMAELAAGLGSGGKNCRMAWGTYAGTGTYGSSKPVKLSVDFYPVAAIVGQVTNKPALYWPCILLRPMTKGAGDSGDAITVKWSDTGIQWYGEAAIDQCNYADYSYAYIIIGYSK